MPRKMPLEAYEEFKAVVGEENVSIDPEVIETYSWSNGLAQAGLGFQWFIPPLGVILPETTDEVQKITEICRKYELKVKAHAGAWMLVAYPFSARTVLLDMRRMRNLEINDIDNYCITETCVTAGETQIETMKKGLNCHLVGAGPNASNLASAVGCQGTGGTSVRTSMNERNILALEWVLPSGEVLKIGSLTTPGAGWFCGDGPGPSLRGMLRGGIGSFGGTGVVTRCALKLYPWYGPPYECAGEPPFYDSVEMPNTYIKFVVWPSHDAEAEGLYKLGESEIIDYNNRWAAGAFTGSMTVSNEEYMELRDNEKIEELFGHGYWTFFMHAPSERSLNYRIKAFEKIVRDTGGEIFDTDLFGKRSEEIAMQNAVRAIWIAKAAYMPTGGNTGSLPMDYETIDQCFKYALPISLDAKEKYIKDDLVLNEGIDNCYACIDEDAHYLHIEHAVLTETWEPKGNPYALAAESLADSFKAEIAPFYMPFSGTPKDMVLYQLITQKIWKMIDPDYVGDGASSLNRFIVYDEDKEKVDSTGRKEKPVQV